MDAFNLKMHFRGRFVEVRVGDIDRCLLIDVINDMYDEAEKHGMSLPKHPSLSYCHKMKSYDLTDDKGLLEMFTRCGDRKDIDIWFGCDTSPCDVLVMARKLRATLNVEVVSDANSDVCPISESFEYVEVQPLNAVCDFDVGSSRQKLQVRRTTKPTSDSPLSPLSPSRSARINPVITEQQFKMPKATAKEKGVYIPRKSREIVEVCGNKRDTRSRALTYEGCVVSSDSEGSYEPSDDGDVVDDENAMADLEEEDNIVISYLDMIDDGYVPFQESEWTVDNEGVFAQLYANGEMYDNKEFGAIVLKPWMLFMDKEHFKDVLRDYCIQEGFYVIVLKADNFRYTAECATLKCDWRIHASVLADGTTWAIKSIDNPSHGCAGVKNHNHMANATWVAQKLIEDIRANPDIPAKAIQNLLMERYGVQMKLATLYRMKDRALKEINGGHDESYKLLPRYCEVVKQTNPGSSAVVAGSVMDNPEKSLQFKSLFLSFGAQFKGLIAGCRSLIGVDGTHLKGNHGGVLLSAVALDGNNELFPIAVGIVESENKNSWGNFFWHLKQVVIDSGRSDWTIISDRQKGVEPALETVWPEAYRRYCARHLCKNFKGDYPGIMMHQLFWRVVNATSEFSFKKALEMVIQHGGKGCAKWFLDLGDKEHWAKHKFDPRISSDENTSNFVESFNATLGVHRTMPVLSLLEGIRRMTMVRHATRQHVADSWPDEGICPNIMGRLKVLKKDSRTCQALPSAKGKFEVHDGRSQLHVSMIDRTCACGLWQISGIPCKHGIKAILTANKNPVDYVSHWYSVKRYKDAYALPINPIPDKEQWPTFDVQTLEPPTLKRAIGRPSRNRRREVGEARKGKRSTTVKCGKCHCFGHNTKTCKGGYTAKEKGQMLGKVSKSRVKMSSNTPLFESLQQLENSIMGGSSNNPESVLVYTQDITTINSQDSGVVVSTQASGTASTHESPTTKNQKRRKI